MSDPEGTPEGTEDTVAGERGRLRGQRRRQAVEREEARRFWREVFASEIGRREMWGLLQAAHTFSPVFACGPNGFPQAEATWYEAGQQGFGQRLWRTWLQFDPEGVVRMMQENASDLRPSKT